jgi:16S rRNA processing protein RimM
VRGDVLVELTTNRLERLEPGTRLHAGDRTLEVVVAKPHHNRWIVTFAGVNDRPSAEALHGVSLEAEPLDDPDALWIHELIGSRVLDAHGHEYGRVVTVVANPASDLLELDGGELIPLRFVTSSADREVVIDPPEGLVEPIDDPVVLVDHDPEWADVAAAEMTRLSRALGQQAVRIDHVGSTAVRGLAAKPIVDLQLSVPSLVPLEPLRKAMAKLGYVHVPDADWDERYPFFALPRSRPRTFHLHACVHGSAEERDHVAFRDRLRADPALASEYEALKRALAAERATDRSSYVDGKDAFVARVLSSGS